MKQIKISKMSKKIAIAIATILVWWFWALTASAAPYENGYDKRAQDVIHNMIVKNGLDADTWPDYKPSQWPIAGIFDKYPNKFGVIWSNSPIRRLTHFIVGSSAPLKGSIDLSGLESLERLYIHSNDYSKITNINIKGNKAIKSISLFQRYISQLDVSEADKLEHLSLQGSDKLTRLDLSKNRELEELEIHDCAIKNLDLSKNYALRKLILGDIPIKKLDLSKNVQLKILGISHCPIGNLDISSHRAFSEIVIHGTTITTIDLRNASRLETIEIIETPLSSLILSDKLNKKNLLSRIEGARLPLSHLAQMTDRQTYNSSQWDVFFEQKVFQPSEKAELDFSSEARLLGAATTIILIKERKDINAEIIPVSTKFYTVKNGRVTITQPGRYHVLMTNPKILSRIVEEDSPQKNFVFTGVIIVKGVKEKNESEKKTLKG